jgi:hypothetical protein
VTVIDTPPYFIDKSPEDQVVKFNNTVFYRLPEYEDLEESPVDLTIFPLNARSFIEISDDKKFLIFYVQDWKDQTEHNISLVLQDFRLNNNTYYFKLTVLNKAPFFLKRLANLVIHLNEYAEYKLPPIVDIEFNPVEILIEAPKFIKFDNASSKLEIFPS